MGDDTVHFTEKSPPPDRFRPGAVYRVLYSIRTGTRSVRRILPLGDVLHDPVLDETHGIVYALRRLADTNGDGLVDRRDAAALWKIGSRREDSRRLSLPAVPLAVNPVNGALIAALDGRLYRFPADGSAPVRLRDAPRRPKRVWFDADIRLHVLDHGGRVFRLRKGRPVRTTEMGISPDGVKTVLRKGIPTLLFPLKNSKPFPLVHGRGRWILMRSFDVNTYLFLYREGPPRALLAVAPLRGKWMPLFRFPGNCTRFHTGRDGRSVAFLTTTDTDRNGRLDPASADKSALSIVRIR